MSATSTFNFSDRSAITGVGETAFIKGAENTAVDMMLEASRKAIADAGLLGTAVSAPAAGYGAVYNIEIVLLFISLAVLGPLAGTQRQASAYRARRLGLADLPG